MASSFAGITWEWRRAEAQHLQAVHALNSATDTIQSLVRLHTRAWEDSARATDVTTRASSTRWLAPIVDAAHAYPELRQFPSSPRRKAR